MGGREVIETNEDSMMKDSNWKIKDFHNVSRVLRHRSNIFTQSSKQDI